MTTTLKVTKAMMMTMTVMARTNLRCRVRYEITQSPHDETDGASAADDDDDGDDMTTTTMTTAAATATAAAAARATAATCCYSHHCYCCLSSPHQIPSKA